MFVAIEKEKFLFTSNYSNLLYLLWNKLKVLMYIESALPSLFINYWKLSRMLWKYQFMITITLIVKVTEFTEIFKLKITVTLIKIFTKFKKFLFKKSTEGIKFFIQKSDLSANFKDSFFEFWSRFLWRYKPDLKRSSFLSLYLY